MIDSHPIWIKKLELALSEAKKEVDDVLISVVAANICELDIQGNKKSNFL